MIQVRNKVSGNVIEVPLSHAMDVLIPQGGYSLVEEEHTKALYEDTISDDGETVLSDDQLDFCTKKELMKILDNRQIRYNPAQRKAELLELLKRNNQLGGV